MAPQKGLMPSKILFKKSLPFFLGERSSRLVSWTAPFFHEEPSSLCPCPTKSNHQSLNSEAWSETYRHTKRPRRQEVVMIPTSYINLCETNKFHAWRHGRLVRLRPLEIY